jgi:hypothetical protein
MKDSPVNRDKKRTQFKMSARGTNSAVFGMNQDDLYVIKKPTMVEEDLGEDDISEDISSGTISRVTSSKQAQRQSGPTI